MSNQPLTPEQRRIAKAQVVATMNQGWPWQTAVDSVGLPISRATAYRWQRRVRLEGEAALNDQRHGHVYKLREPVRRWLVSYCQHAPHTPSLLLQQVLREQFNVNLSIGYLNQIRAELGVRYVRPQQEKMVTDLAWCESAQAGREQAACCCWQRPTPPG